MFIINRDKYLCNTKRDLFRNTRHDLFVFCSSTAFFSIKNMASSTAVEYEDEAEATPITVAAGSGGKEAVSPMSRKVAYDVLVVNAERHGTGVSAYLTYEVRTKMTGGAFGEREFAVRRRYADFLWLRNTMAGNYHHALIPALSDKEKLPSKLGMCQGPFLLTLDSCLYIGCYA